MKLKSTKRINRYFSIKKLASNKYEVINHHYKKTILAISYDHAMSLIRCGKELT